MKVVLDTNVILDAVLEQADYKSAQALLMAVATEKISGVVTANSITDIYYVARKMMGDQDARRAIARILSPRVDVRESVATLTAALFSCKMRSGWHCIMPAY